LQKYGHISQTGVIDEATRELLKKPRCGNPDFEIKSGQRRQKRFVLGHTKWEKVGNKVTWS
jgi:matrix metalloproteinase-16 (membrane-inserted)